MFYENIDGFENSLEDLSNFEVFKNFKKIKEEVANYTQFYDKVIKLYYYQSFENLKQIQENVSKKARLIKDRLSCKNMMDKDVVKDNLEVLNIIKDEIHLYEDSQKKNILKSRTFLEPAIQKIREKNADLDRFVSEEFLKFQTKDKIIQKIQLGLLKDKKIALVKKFLRKMIMRKRRKHLGALINLSKKVEWLSMRRTWYLLLS